MFLHLSVRLFTGEGVQGGVNTGLKLECYAAVTQEDCLVCISDLTAQANCEIWVLSATESQR